ncbi:hypothetical protein B0J14DRAFT_276883 [Halenospora varia]|nr:hypothetical protein B0J14DRAFT_276883 [Halenospora varia]
MSPVAFKQQVTQLNAELTRCYDYCDAVRSNRRLGSTHEALDKLQAGLKESIHGIQLEYNALRKVIGTRMDLGDDTARLAINAAIREVQVDIQSRLFNIAFKRRESNEPEMPGFKHLLKKVQTVEDHVAITLENLAQRFESEKTHVPKPTPKPTPKTGEAIISLKELDILIKHMKNSWTEMAVSGTGKILYVNAFDDKIQQWEKPEGYIKKLPRSTKPAKPARTSTWEQRHQPRHSSRDDQWDSSSWSSSSGW